MTLFLPCRYPVLADPELGMILNGTSPHQYDMMEPQQPSIVVIGLALLTAAYIVRECRFKDAWIVVATYFLTDLYMTVLHIFLDHPTTKAKFPVSAFKTMASIFQHHHNFPIDVLYMNHVASIDELNILTLGIPWVWRLAAALKRRSVPPQIHLLAFCSSLFGIIGAFNHVCMHARTHHIAIPGFIEWGQNVGLLPHNSFHRKHHTPPHDVNYAFLAGGSAVYDQLNTAALQMLGPGMGSYVHYGLVVAVFAALQPFHLSSALSAFYWMRSGKNDGGKAKGKSA